ncbi:polyadenylation and cleavage factor homolog 4-like [Rosa rugosa]|uniref:polyadenylation and cleavage factor homolog 4-like n=1 Tax=Rosa rugosa TaxID=74645 RepID=UPI002B403B1F|nr:polyadenylation and cleavage factor homolog 4-like [Rosa rugosa]
MPFPANHRNQVPPVGHFQPQFLPPRPNFYPSPQTLVPPYSCGGYNFQGQGGSTSASSVPHRLPPQGVSPVNGAGPVVSGLLGSLMAQGVISLKNQSRGGLESTSPLNCVPLVPQRGAFPVQNAAAYVPVVAPGLIDSLLAQGVISLKKQSPALKEEKDAVVGCEFSGLDLNLRRESVVIGLYEGGLPRQCKSCGLRFKCEEQHTAIWIGAEAETLLSGVVLPAADTSGAAEKKRKTGDEEMVVPADEDQSKCALCRDAFVEFYSHETDEWMYKGAVYLNAPQGLAPEMGRSQLGPIVHAKCWSEGSRKRLRRS